MMRTDLHLRLADGTDVGYAEAGDPEGYPVVHLHGSPSSRLEVSLPAFGQAAEDLGVRLIAPDRPGMGLTTFRRFSILDYPRQIGSFADALGLGRFAATGLSGGGKYACACAWVLSGRVTRVALVSSTCSFDLPGAKETWSREDRLLYGLAYRAPWMTRLMLAKAARDVRREPTSLFSMLDKLGPADQEILARDDVQHALSRNWSEAFRTGSRGPTRDLTLEARPWGVPLEQIDVPIDIWCGEDDRAVSPQQSRILADALRLSRRYVVPRAGHLLLAGGSAEDILRSVLDC
jgi:pimeloyl-ACP methyl ester carboxylesterase